MNTTNIKTVKRVVIPKQSTKKSISYENRGGEKSNNLIDIIRSADDNEYFDFESSNGDTIKFSAETTPFCCGLIELGDLNVNTNHDKKFLIGVLDGVVEKSKCTLLINTNGTGKSILYEEALIKCKYWQLVKTFINPGSRNTIKMWVSKN